MKFCRLVSCLLVSVTCVALAPATVFAQAGVIEKFPSGPGISINTMNNQITAQVDEVITWTVEITNAFSPDPIFADFWDTPQDDECSPGGFSRSYANQPSGLNGSQQENAPPSAISYLDPNGDGNCEETVVDDGGGLVECDTARQQLVIRNAFVPGNVPGFPPNPGVTTIRYLTYLDRSVTSGQFMCNWAQIFDDKENTNQADDTIVQPTGHPGRPVTGCTCLIAAPPNEIDFEATKTATPDVAGLIPGDPNSTILYTITARNTGGVDISGTFSDILPDGLEWVDLDPAVTFVSCPAPLDCDVLGPDEISVRGYFLAATDPDSELIVQARARVTCDAATDDDTGVVCNRGEFSVQGATFPTDDPAEPGVDDPTCLNVIFSKLVDSTKEVRGFIDNDADGLISAGDTIQFRITARNTGRLVARDVQIVDDELDAGCFDVSTLVIRNGGVFTPVPPTITWNVGDLAPNFGFATVEFDVELTADQICCNQATINSAEREDCGMDPVPTDNPASPLTPDDETCALPGPRPNLDVRKSWTVESDEDGSGGASDLDIIKYTVTVTNNGPGTATAASFLDTLVQCHTRYLDLLPNGFPTSRLYPNEISTTDGTDWGTDNSRQSGGAFNPGAVIIDDFGGANGIVPGETVTVSFYIVVQGLARCCNQAFVSYAEMLEPEPSDDIRTPGLPGDRTCFLDPPTDPDYIFDKALQAFDLDGDGYIGVNDRGRYTLTLTSSGSSDLDNIVLTDIGGTCFDIIEGSLTSVNATASLTGNDVTAQPPGPLAPAESMTVTFDVTFLSEGRCCNQATFTSDEFAGAPSNDPSEFIPDNATCVDVVDPPSPSVSMSIIKTSDALPGSCIDSGTSVTYTLRVTNTGETAVTGWTIEDILPLTFSNITVTPPLVLTGSTVSLTGASLAPGAFEEFTYVVELPCGGPGGSFTNTASLEYDVAGSPTTDTGSTTLSWGLPDLTPSKKVVTENDENSSGSTDPGETVTYVITVDNAGSCDARSVVVTDPIDSNIDPATLVISDGGIFVLGMVRWDSATTPALAAVSPGIPVALSVTGTVRGSAPAGAFIRNSATITATGHPVTRCVPTDPQHVAAASTVCVAPCGGTQDLLRNSELTSRSFAQMRTLVFTAETPNITTCGVSDLDPATDTTQVDVQASLEGAGVTIPLDAAPGGSVLVFYEITERCQPVVEGGADELICVRKSGTDIVIRASANPLLCN